MLAWYCLPAGGRASLMAALRDSLSMIKTKRNEITHLNISLSTVGLLFQQESLVMTARMWAYKPSILRH